MELEQELKKCILHLENNPNDKVILNKYNKICDKILFETINIDNFVKWLEKESVKNNNSFTQNTHGFMYHFGLSVKKDHKKAVKYYTLSATASETSKGNAFAQNNLGYMYGHGHGVEQDYKKAVKYYTLSVNQGNASAQRNLKILLNLKANITVKEKLDYLDKIEKLEKEVFKFKVTPFINKHLIPVLTNIVFEYL